jgi:hypothetical protein
VGVYVGAGFYSFKDHLGPGEYAGSPEMCGGLVLWVPLMPSVYVAREFDLTEGTHITFSLSHAVPVSEGGVSLNFEGRLDLNQEHYFDDSGFSFADLSATLDIPAGPITISPLVAVQVGIADEVYFGEWGLFGLKASAAFWEDEGGPGAIRPGGSSVRLVRIRSSGSSRGPCSCPRRAKTLAMNRQADRR